MVYSFRRKVYNRLFYLCSKCFSIVCVDQMQNRMKPMFSKTTSRPLPKSWTAYWMAMTTDSDLAWEVRHQNLQSNDSNLQHWVSLIILSSSNGSKPKPYVFRLDLISFDTLTQKWWKKCIQMCSILQKTEAPCFHVFQIKNLSFLIIFMR